MRAGALIAALGSMGGGPWACGEPASSATAPSPTPAATTVPSEGSEAPAATAADPMAVPEAEAAPAPEPPAAPAPLVAPDGTVASACGEVHGSMACIPGGPFIRGSDAHWDHAKPQAEVWLQTFWMDVYEVTYAEYQACIQAGACRRGSGPQYVDFDRPVQPINGINWFDAQKYCEAQGKRLPTEAEWEKAARGTDGRTYPWGEEEADCSLAIIKTPEEGRGCGVKKSGKKPETGYPWNVGSRAPNEYGLYDMAGNSYEWVADWFARSYEECGEACSGVDPKGPCDGAETCQGHRLKVVRGGSWYWDPERATTIYRRAHVPSNDPFHHFGFRCASDVGAEVRVPDVQWRRDLAAGQKPGGDPGGQVQ